MDQVPRRLSNEELRSLVDDLMGQERLAALQYARALVPVVAFLAGLIVVAGLVGSPGETEFYRAAATVIPTLLLTLAVQGKFFRLSDLAKSPLHQALQGKQISRDDLKRLGATSFQA